MDRNLALEVVRVTEAAALFWAEPPPKVSVLPSAFDFLMAKGYDRQYGARQLRRAVERYLENILAEEILRGKVDNGEIVEVEAGDDRLDFHPPKGAAAPASPAAAEKPAEKPARRKKKEKDAE